MTYRGESYIGFGTEWPRGGFIKVILSCWCPE